MSHPSPPWKFHRVLCGCLSWLNTWGVSQNTLGELHFHLVFLKPLCIPQAAARAAEHYQGAIGEKPAGLREKKKEKRKIAIKALLPPWLALERPGGWLMDVSSVSIEEKKNQ